MKDDRVYLRHILECLDAIQEYTKEGQGIFLTDRKRRKQRFGNSRSLLNPHKDCRPI